MCAQGLHLGLPVARTHLCGQRRHPIPQVRHTRQVISATYVGGRNYVYTQTKKDEEGPAWVQAHRDKAKKRHRPTGARADAYKGTHARARNQHRYTGRQSQHRLKQHGRTDRWATRQTDLTWPNGCVGILIKIFTRSKEQEAISANFNLYRLEFSSAYPASFLHFRRRRRLAGPCLFVAFAAHTFLLVLSCRRWGSATLRC